MGWDGMAWDGVGWDWKAWDGLGWDGIAHQVEHETTSRKNIPVNVEVRCS
jgi:hypothetical protein